MAFEYQQLKSSLFEDTQPDCASHPLKLCIFELEWPFFDKNQFLTMQHNYYRTWADVASDPTRRENDPIIRDRIAEFEEEKYTKVSIIKNPVGSALWAITTPAQTIFADGTRRAKGSVLIFSYFMEYRQSGNLGDPPIDPFTGQPFIVTDKGDTIEITSAKLQGDEPTIQYEVSKVVR